MTIMSCIDDERDKDIVLEEVSKIFRCTKCLRCYLSEAKFVEHFPVHHPDKLAFYLESQRKLTSPISSSSSSSESEADDAAKTPEKTFHNYDATKERPKISLKRHKTKPSDNGSSSPSLQKNQNTSTDEREHSGQAQSSVPLDTCGPALNIQYEKDEDEMVPKRTKTKLISRLKKKAKKKINGHLHPDPSIHFNESGPSNGEPAVEANLINGDARVQGENSKIAEEPGPGEQVEVITLSDSSDDDMDNNGIADVNSSRYNAETHYKVKQEVDCDQQAAKIVGPPIKEGVDAISDQTVQEPIVHETVSVSVPPQPVPKKYLCQYCNRLFTRDRTLQGHVRGMHRSELEDEELYEKVRKQNLICNGEKGNKFHHDGNQMSDKAQRSSIAIGRPVLKNGKGKRLSRSDLRKKRLKEEPTGMDKKVPLKNDGCVPTLSFSCKWCPEKFANLDALKRHAINAHIKYKMME